MSDKAAAEQILAELREEIRMSAGTSGREEVITLLRNLDVYAIEAMLPHPLPMFFSDAWQEVLELVATGSVNDE